MHITHKPRFAAFALAALLCLCAALRVVAGGTPAPALERAEAAAQTPEWVHPLAAGLGSKNLARGATTGDLYHRAISWDVPIRVWTFTKYHPGEASGMGGGWNTADGGGFRPGCIAAALRWYPYWRGHEFWVEGHGRVVVGDNGPGWSGRYTFDLPGWTAAEVNALDAGRGKEQRRAIVIRCPRAQSCSCDFAVAWRKHCKR